MAVFKLTDGAGSEVELELTWHALTANTWKVLTTTGDPLMPSDEGTWTWSAPNKSIEFVLPSGSALIHLDGVNMTWSTDPFENLHSGDSGDGLTIGGDPGIIGWTFVSS